MWRCLIISRSIMMRTTKSTEEIETEKRVTRSTATQQLEHLKLLTGGSPKKRKHIQVEYDVSTSKVKKDVNIQEDSKISLKDEKPLHWEAVLDNLREMRKNRNAPVDSIGSHKCRDRNETPKIRRYQELLALMLSRQTKGRVTHTTMAHLKKHGCTVDNILNTTDEKLGELIYRVGFWKTKVKYIKETTEMLKSGYGGDVPNTAENLCKLPGVDPNMAHLCMQTAWNDFTEIGVDTYVHRICNRLGWVKTKTPEETRKGLEKWLPHELWKEVYYLLVGFGQRICRPMKPQCATCLNCEICPSAIKTKLSKE